MRRTFCRACGENKGHNFGSCKNAAAIRRIVQSQDTEIQGLLCRAEVAEKEAKDGAGIRESFNVQVRLIHMLLDLWERRK
jgi:hypothetical protein